MVKSLEALRWRVEWFSNIKIYDMKVIEQKIDYIRARGGKMCF